MRDAKRRPPAFDQRGLNVFDPNDRSGQKSEFITRVQHRVLRAHLPYARTNDTAVDLGCGYGRHAALLRELGYRTLGIDPDPALLEFGRRSYPNVQFLQGQLPELPLDPKSCQLICVFNVLRSLHLMGEVRVFDGLGRYLAPGGTVAVIENIRPGHPKYVDEQTLYAWATRERLELELRLPFRVGRRWYLYLMMLGVYPSWALEGTAEREIRRTERRTRPPPFTYHNVLFLFRRAARH